MRDYYYRRNPEVGKWAKFQQARGCSMVWLFCAGRKATEIARDMGISRQAVEKRLKKEGVL